MYGQTTVVRRLLNNVGVNDRRLSNNVWTNDRRLVNNVGTMHRRLSNNVWTNDRRFHIQCWINDRRLVEFTSLLYWVSPVWLLLPYHAVSQPYIVHVKVEM